MEVSLQINELQTLITKILLAYLEQSSPSQEVLISEDYFWTIEKTSLYDVASDPKELTIGSLHDVVMELKKLAHQDSSYIPSTIDIRRISFLLRYLSGI
jgi:hypothetical protein